MALYMTQFSYTTEAWAALTRNPEDRAIPLRAAFEKMGGRLIGMYYCFGEYDGVIIGEVPDNITEAACLLAVTAPGHLRAVKTTVLLSVSDSMQAMKKAGTIMYTGPKG